MKKYIINSTYSKYVFISVSILIAITTAFGCRKSVEADAPYTSLTSENVYENDATAAAVLTGIYTNLSSNSYQFVAGSSGISAETGLSADELTLAGGGTNSNTTLVRFYQNSLNNTINYPWSGFYSCLLQTNTAIEKLGISKRLTPLVKDRLMGEAKFIRAFCYFYLVNLYGDVPLILTSDYRTNASIKRTLKTEVYDQIIIDLTDAKNLLSDQYLASDIQTSASDRIRPTKWAAAALLSRTYLYMGNWVKAEAEADFVINNSTLFSLPILDQAFLKNSKEAIWQLQPVNSDRVTDDARLFFLTSAPGNGRPVYLSSSLVNSFESGDKRRSLWVKDTIFGGNSYSFAFKYRTYTTQSSFVEYLTILRLGELYLIRAEARSQQNNLPGAIADVDKLRSRSSLPLIATTTPTISQAALQTAILHERQVELFTEWGHRWFDLKRTGKIDAIMNAISSQKGTTWNSNFALFPLPMFDIKQNPNLIQNAGY